MCVPPKKTPAGMAAVSYQALELPRCSRWERGISSAMDWEPSAAGTDLPSPEGALLCESFRRTGCAAGRRRH